MPVRHLEKRPDTSRLAVLSVTIVAFAFLFGMLFQTEPRSGHKSQTQSVTNGSH